MFNHLIKLAAALTLLMIQIPAHAVTGDLFAVSSSGPATNLSITLCLNAEAQISCQNYAVSGTNINIHTTIADSYPKAGIKINTPGYSAAVGCAAIGNGFCSFAASSTPASIIVSSNTPSNPRFAYVSSWDGPALSLCTVESDGTFSNCNAIQAPNNSNVNQLSNYPGSVVVNPSGTFLYIGDYSNGLIRCSINSSNGALSNCGLTGSNYGSVLGLTLNPNGSLAYIGGYGSGLPLDICSVDAISGDLSNCFSSSYTSFAYATYLQFIAGTDSVYVGDYDLTTLYLCQYNATTGDVTSCSPTPSSPPAQMDYTTGIALNASGTILYVVSDNDSVIYKCPVNPDITLGSCTLTGSALPASGWTGATNGFAITLNSAGTFAYIGEYNTSGTISVCAVDSTSGELTNCQYTGTGFTDPLQVALLY